MVVPERSFSISLTLSEAVSVGVAGGTEDWDPKPSPGFALSVVPIAGGV